MKKESKTLGITRTQFNQILASKDQDCKRKDSCGRRSPIICNFCSDYKKK